MTDERRLWLLLLSLLLACGVLGWGMPSERPSSGAERLREGRG